MNTRNLDPGLLETDHYSKSFDSPQNVCDRLRVRRQALTSEKESRDERSVDPRKDLKYHELLSASKGTIRSNPADSQLLHARNTKHKMVRAVRSESFTGNDCFGRTGRKNSSDGPVEDDHSALTNLTAPARSDSIRRPDTSSRRKLSKKRWKHAAGSPNDGKIKPSTTRNSEHVTSSDERDQSGWPKQDEEMSIHGEQVVPRVGSPYYGSSRPRGRSISPKRAIRKNSTSPGKATKEDESKSNKRSNSRRKDRDLHGTRRDKEVSPNRRMADIDVPRSRPPGLSVASLIRETNERVGEVIHKELRSGEDPFSSANEAPSTRVNAFIATIVKEANRTTVDASSIVSSTDSKDNSFQMNGQKLVRSPSKTQNGPVPSNQEVTEPFSFQPLGNQKTKPNSERSDDAQTKFCEVSRKKDDKYSVIVQPKVKPLKPLTLRNFDETLSLSQKPPMHPKSSDVDGEELPEKPSKPQPKSMKKVLKQIFSRSESKSKHTKELPDSLEERGDDNESMATRKSRRVRSKYFSKDKSSDAEAAVKSSNDWNEPFEGFQESPDEGSESVAAEADVCEYLSLEDRRAMNKIRKYAIEAQNLLNKATKFMDIDPMEVEIFTIKAFAYANEAEKVSTTLGSSPAWKAKEEPPGWASSASASTSINSFTHRMDREEHLRRLSLYDFRRSGVQSVCCSGAGLLAVSPQDIKELAFETMKILQGLNDNVTLPDLLVIKIHAATSPTTKLRWTNYGSGPTTNTPICGTNSRHRSTQILDEKHRISQYQSAIKLGDTLPSGVALREESNSNTKGQRPVTPGTSPTLSGPISKGSTSSSPAEQSPSKAVVGESNLDIFSDTASETSLPTQDENEDKTLETDTDQGTDQGTYHNGNNSVVSRTSTSTFSAMEDMLDVVAIRFLDNLCAGPQEKGWYDDEEYCTKRMRQHRKSRGRRHF